MARKKPNRFSSAATVLAPSQTSLVSQKPHTKAEGQTAAECRKLGLVITAESVLAQYAMVKTREVIEHSMAAYGVTIEEIEAVRQGSNLRPEVQACLDDFAEHLMDRSGKLYLAMLETTAHNIGESVNRNLYFEDEFVEEPRRGLLGWLFGR